MLGTEQLAMDNPLLTLPLRREEDIVPVRQFARQAAALMGFEPQDQSRIATAISEIARNAFVYGGGGSVGFSLDQSGPPQLVVRVEDHGPGIANLAAVLDHRYTSRTGLGLGIVGARRLMDRFDISSVPGRGTTVTLGKTLSMRQAPFTSPEIDGIVAELARRARTNPIAEIQQQNSELLRTLDELRARQDDLARLNRELEETNRGVVALYAELDERAEHLQQASELKSRFLSNMSHELRTPLNSILSLARILTDRLDGDLTAEQERQVRYIESAAETLAQLVNDLLDLAKVEAGRVSVQADDFGLDGLFGTLRGMLRPLISGNSEVSLVFETPDPSLILHTDEGKVSQILRNLISNALKYTERGEVRVSAIAGANDTVVFSVADTGVGIAPEDETRIFDEFAQVENARNSAVRGTGLGLPLSRRFASMLGGAILVESEVGRGSTFHVVIPRVYAGSPEVISLPDAPPPQPPRLPVLVVEDSAEALFLYEKYLAGTGCRVVGVRTVDEARALLARSRPAAVILSLALEAGVVAGLVAEWKAAAAPRALPVLVMCAPEDEASLSDAGADACGTRPIDREWLVAHLTELVPRPGQPTLLIVDDEEVSRYILRSALEGLPCRLVEASGVDDAIVQLRENPPDAVILDLMMPQRDGRELLQAIRTSPDSRDIPVIIHTSSQLSPLEEEAMAREGVVVVSKHPPSDEAAGAQLRAAVARTGLVPTPEENSSNV